MKLHLPDEERQHIAQAAQGIAAAISRRDVSALRDALAPGFVHRTPGGESLDAEAFLHGIAAIPGEIVFVRLEHVAIDFCGATAIVSGTQHAQVRLDGQIIDDRRAFVDCFVQSAAAWRLQVAIELPTASVV